jgi:DNA-binding HxlR family transcriptional regulator
MATKKQEDKREPIIYAVDVISGKWKIYIILELLKDTKRNSELIKSINGISQKVLTQNLKELEKDKIVIRKVYPQIPPKVEYSLTKIGKRLQPVFMMLAQWGEDYEATVL